MTGIAVQINPYTPMARCLPPHARKDGPLSSENAAWYAASQSVTLTHVDRHVGSRPCGSLGDYLTMPMLLNPSSGSNASTSSLLSMI